MQSLWAPGAACQNCRAQQTVGRQPGTTIQTCCAWEGGSGVGWAAVSATLLGEIAMGLSLLVLKCHRTSPAPNTIY